MEMIVMMAITIEIKELVEKRWRKAARGFKLSV
jgi:hypothetical protein